MNHQALLWNVHCARQKLFLTQTHLGKKKIIFARKVNEMTFNLPLNPRYAKNVIRNADWKAALTSVEIKPIPFQSNLVMFLKVRF